MKKKAVRVTALILIFMLSLPVGASAAAPDTVQPSSNAYIKSCNAGISAQGNGVLKITFEVMGTGTMTSIGASCIKVYVSGSNTPVYTFWSSSYPDMLGSNRSYYSSSVTYNGTSGTKYYAVVTCYAKNSSGSGTQTYTTSTVTA